MRVFTVIRPSWHFPASFQFLNVLKFCSRAADCVIALIIKYYLLVTAIQHAIQVHGFLGRCLFPFTLMGMFCTVVRQTGICAGAEGARRRGDAGSGRQARRRSGQGQTRGEAGGRPAGQPIRAALGVNQGCGLNVGDCASCLRLSCEVDRCWSYARL